MSSRQESVSLKITTAEYNLFVEYFQVKLLHKQDLEKVVNVGCDLVVDAFENRSKVILFYSNGVKQQQRFPYFMPLPSRQGKKEAHLSLDIQQGDLKKLQELTGLENLAGDYLMHVIKNHFSSLFAGYTLQHQNFFFSPANLDSDFYNKIENWFPGRTV